MFKVRDDTPKYPDGILPLESILTSEDADVNDPYVSELSKILNQKMDEEE